MIQHVRNICLFLQRLAYITNMYSSVKPIMKGKFFCQVKKNHPKLQMLQIKLNYLLYRSNSKNNSTLKKVALYHTHKHKANVVYL